MFITLFVVVCFSNGRCGTIIKKKKNRFLKHLLYIIVFARDHISQTVPRRRFMKYQSGIEKLRLFMNKKKKKEHETNCKIRFFFCFAFVNAG